MRRFRYSLRTVFVILMACSVWLGYSANWVRQRNDVIAAYGLAKWAEDHKAAPGLLWLFGAKGYSKLIVVLDARDENWLTDDQQLEITRIRRLFPEAHIEVALSSP